MFTCHLGPARRGKACRPRVPGTAWAPPCCLSLPSRTISFTCFSLAAQHRSSGLCLGQRRVTPGRVIRWVPMSSPRWVPTSCPCRAIGPAPPPDGARECFVLVPNGEQVTSAKNEERGGAGGYPRTAGPVKKRRSQSVARSLIVVLWPGLWGASSLDLGLGLVGWVGFFSPLSISRFCGQGAGRCPRPPLSPPAV